MIKEFIVVLTHKQEKRLIEMAQEQGIDDDLSYLQGKINKWLDEERDPNHCEK